MSTRALPAGRPHKEFSLTGVKLVDIEVGRKAFFNVVLPDKAADLALYRSRSKANLKIFSDDENFLNNLVQNAMPLKSAKKSLIQQRDEVLSISVNERQVAADALLLFTLTIGMGTRLLFRGGNNLDVQLAQLDTTDSELLTNQTEMAKLRVFSHSSDHQLGKIPDAKTEEISEGYLSIVPRVLKAMSFSVDPDGRVVFVYPTR